MTVVHNFMYHFSIVHNNFPHKGLINVPFQHITIIYSTCIYITHKYSKFHMQGTAVHVITIIMPVKFDFRKNIEQRRWYEIFMHVSYISIQM